MKRRSSLLQRAATVACGIAAAPVVANAQPAATKADWRDLSELDYIRWGLDDLVARCAELDVESVAMPALGCGLGGLDFDQVLPLIQGAFAGSAVKVTVYRPQEAGRR